MALASSKNHRGTAASTSARVASHSYTLWYIVSPLHPHNGHLSSVKYPICTARDWVRTAPVAAAR